MLNKEFQLAVGDNNLITFTYSSSMDITTFNAEEGMTWYEFINSTYNKPFDVQENGYHHKFHAFSATGGVSDYTFNSDGSYWSPGPPISLEYQIKPWDDSLLVLASDKIIDGHEYSYAICYAAGTLITLHDGTTKKIEDITYDDDLLVWDFDNGCFATAKPSWISKAQLSSYYYKITLEDGTQLDLIGSNGDCHRLFNVDKSKFVYGSRFNLGEKTFKEDNSTPKVISIELIDKEVVYYNMNTKYHINCFINGVLSSCRYNNLYPIKDMKFVKTHRAKVPLSAYSNVPADYYHDLRLGEVDVTEFPIEETNDYVQKRIMLKA